MNYYCYIAGMPDLHPDNSKNIPDLDVLIKELTEVLTKKDLSLLQLLLNQYDNENFLSYLQDKNSSLTPLGTLRPSLIESIVNHLEDSDVPKPKEMPSYYEPFYRAITDEKNIAQIGLPSDYLTSLYYNEGCKSKNAFLASWFTFCLNLNNILAAYYGRKYELDIQKLVLGDSEIAQKLRHSNLRDFGLTGMVENLDKILAIAEESNLLERERKIDALKWEWLEEHIFFNYFTVERILAYFIRVQLLTRWKDLNVERGKEVFKELLNTMEKQVTL